MVLALSLPGWGQSQARQLLPNHFAITGEQVAKVLSGRGIKTEAEQVTLLANVVATAPDPTLEIIKVERTGGLPATKLSIRLACRVSGTCLPFYAIVTESRSSRDGHVDNSAVTTRSSIALLNSPAVVTMRAGTHATLVMDDDRSHIQVAVVSLENGTAGQRIRVASPDHKQFYIGEVVTANLLKRSY
jgi:hypothetical protein